MILDRIVAHKRIEVERLQKTMPEVELRAQALALGPARNMLAALQSPNVALIAEFKPASPSRGEIRPDANPRRFARLYAANGAAAMSVLTDRQFFGGEPSYLERARAACSLPVLRKDFVVDEYQVYESRALGADAILLIARLLDDSRLRDFRSLAEGLGMVALIEAHDETDLARALISGARLVGINNRNLADFAVDLGTTERLASLVPPGTVLVSESGIESARDVERAARAGVDAVLVGSALMSAVDVGSKVRELSSVARISSAAEVRR